MKGIGRMARCEAKELRSGKAEQNLRETGKMAPLMELASSFMRKKVKLTTMKANGRMASFQAKALWSGKMAKQKMENGKMGS